MVTTFFRTFAAMYQNSSHKIFSVALGFLVLLSTVSFTMEKHFCGDTLIDTAIFSQADTCGMDVEGTSITSEEQSCCKNEVEHVKGQDQLKKASFEDFNFDQQLTLTALLYNYINLFEGLSEQVIPHKNYTPPNLVVDIQVLDQVFII
ncbi:hypothetical protein LX77_02667 [Gelidibacter algens]|uniref:Secreted protein n=1 Tax=Gelidibacter algens TaxID=49280 RepID=A0A327S0V2_9FLAO|nr:hypothetical protein LX77_02667 [Gelidibacter algens]